MTAYRLDLRPAAARQLDNLPDDVYARVATAIDGLADEPRPRQSKRLSDVQPPLWRIRVGRFRVVYAVDDAERVVTIVRVALRREDTYRGL